ncbi:hypothetical protein C8R46DRAFT_1042809 [Mycena filopes]|nr:hypothetical protein C8R46DRAFT_1042809 [Mycena filopes]
MQFTLKSAFVALAAALAVVAAPAVRLKPNPPRRRSPSIQQGASTDSALVDGHVFIYTDANFAGDCTNYGFFDDQCSNFPGEFQDDISSFGPDAGWSCTMYTSVPNTLSLSETLMGAFHSDANCNGDTYTGTNPGFGTLPGFLNDAFSSVRCERI